MKTQETLEQVAERILHRNEVGDEDMILCSTFPNTIKSMVEMAKWQQERSCSEKEVLAFGKSCFYKGFDKAKNDDANCYTAFREEIGTLFEQFKNKIMKIIKLEARQPWLCEVNGTTYVRTEIKWTDDTPNDITWHVNENQVGGKVYLTDEQLEKLFLENNVEVNTPPLVDIPNGDDFFKNE